MTMMMMVVVVVVVVVVLMMMNAQTAATGEGWSSLHGQAVTRLIAGC